MAGTAPGFIGLIGTPENVDQCRAIVRRGRHIGRSDQASANGRVSIYPDMKSGSPMLIGNYEFTREDAVLMNTR